MEKYIQFMDTLFWLPVFYDQVRFLNRPWSWSTLIHWYILVLFVSRLKPNDNNILINLIDLPRCRASDQPDRLTWIWVFGFSEDELLGLCLYPYWCLGLCLLFLCLVDKKNQWLGLCLLLLCLVDKKDLLLGLCLCFWVCDFWTLILYF